MRKKVYDVRKSKDLSAVTLSCDTGCQSCKRALNAAQIFQWHAIKYSISNQIRRWSSDEIYKIYSQRLSRCESLLSRDENGDAKNINSKKQVIWSAGEHFVKWHTRCCFVAWNQFEWNQRHQISLLHYKLYIHSFFQRFRNSQNVDVANANANYQAACWLLTVQNNGS